MSNFDAALEALADWQRRTLCEYLLNRSDELYTYEEALTHLETEARDAVDDVGSPSVRTGDIEHRLHHVHLPKLADANVIKYDTEERLIRPDRMLSTVEQIMDALDDDGGVLQEPCP
ncbi:hypothetical protein ACFR9U_07820 [Halorientalis brevis]|uniref:DUF7344 domain-containing protein n=1 Tax=Halorientalis brevis TaxID=1126241 RepID=A0ABD6C964_9EURY|nr:hypothetical protein [Halorientalis brevis]